MGIWVSQSPSVGGGSSSAAGIVNTSSTFDQIAAAATLVTDMRFGTAATGGTHQIKNLTDLTTNFYYDPSWASNPTTTRMAYHDQFFEFAKFTDPDAATVYSFGANSLTLQPYTTHSWDGIVTEVAAGNAPVSGTSVLASSLGLSSTASLWIGRVVSSPYGQFACRVTAFTGTNVTLTALNNTTGQTLGIGSGFLLIWTPMTAIPVTGAVSSGATSLTLSTTPPAAVQNGMVICPVDSFNYIKRYYYGSIATISGTSVTITAPGLQQGVSSGGGGVFVPYTRTGQLVPKLTWNEPGIGKARLMELDATWASNDSGIAPRMQYCSTLAQYNAAGGSSVPMGGWLAWWLYERQGDATVNDDAGSEIDIREQFCRIDFGPGDFSSSWHNNTRVYDQSGSIVNMYSAEGYPVYIKWNGQDQAYMAVRSSGPPVVPGQVLQKRVSGTIPAACKLQLLWEKEFVSIYVDGELRLRLRGVWGSVRPAQMLISAALGVLSDLSSQHIPWTNAGLANCRMIIRSLKIWDI